MRRLAAAAAMSCLAAVGCAGSSHPATARSGAPAAVSSSGSSTRIPLSNWPTYDRTGSRSGVARHGLSAPFRRSWTAHLDGAVYGQPLVVNGLVLAATENDSVYALAPSTGRVRWRTHLGSPQPLSGLPCGDIDPVGITGTPAYDARTGSVFVVTETAGSHHTLWALSATTGRRRWHRTADLLPNRSRLAEQERSALLIDRGRVITTYGGRYGDCANYVGYVTSTATNGKGKTSVYAVPTAREAGMWAPAGAVTGQNGNVYVTSGNGAATGRRFDKSDSVTELTPKSLHRVAIFAPNSWAADNASDLDLGSSSPVPVNGRLVIAGKRGTVYLLRQSLGGVGGQLATVSGCPAYGGAAHVGHTVLMPCKGANAVRALHVGRHSMRWLWTASGVYSSPVVAGNKVYVADLNSGALKVLSLKTGHVTASVPVGSLPHFPSETVDGRFVLVGTLSGVTAVRGA